MKLYNSLSRRIEEFEPVEKEKVIMYVCGLTPYDHAHLGHARTYIAFDMLKRFLSWKGYKVFHIQNITDVDDKILMRCKETGEKPQALTERFHNEALQLFRRLHIIDADVYPKVTEHIPEIIALIQKIMDNGYAYETETGVYFDVRKFKDYGKLSGQKLDKILAGARKEVDETKKHPADFALWKKTKGELLEFDSPWGKGRPGWHIECSAMAGKYAKTLDIHGGARDLIFPHHENEIAQSEAANGVQFVKYWLHTGFLTVNGEKMSKSLGNIITLKDVLAQYSANTIRMFFAMTHYRSPIDYNPNQLKQAEATVQHIFNFLDRVKAAADDKTKPRKQDSNFKKEVENKFKNFYYFLEMDFDMPTALTYIFSLMKSVNTHLEGDSYDREALSSLSLEMEKVLYILGIEKEKKEIDNKTTELVQFLIELRDELRAKKDFVLADKIRERLKQLGIVLEDGKNGTTWKEFQ